MLPNEKEVEAGGVGAAAGAGLLAAGEVVENVKPAKGVLAGESPAAGTGGALVFVAAVSLAAGVDFAAVLPKLKTGAGVVVLLGASACGAGNALAADEAEEVSLDCFLFSSILSRCSL